MRVKVLSRLKNGSQIINAGTVFEGTEKTLPDFVLYELDRDRGLVEILPEPIKKRAARKVKAPVKAEAAPSGSTEKKAVPKATPAEAGASLRSKLNSAEK